MISLRFCHRRLYATPKFTYAEWGYFLDVAKRNYHLMQESQHFPLQNMLEINSQLKELVKNGQLENARQMFDKMTQRDEVSWTNMISGYVNDSSSLQALSLFSEMRRDPILKMDPFALSLTVKACGLSMHLRCGYNEEGLVYFSEMWRDGVECDSYAYAIVLKACADIGCLNYGMEMHTRIVKKGLDISSYVANSLATMYNKCGKLNYGMCLFERMKLRDVVSWTTVITTYVQIGQDQYGIQAFLRMKESSVTPNAYTFAAVVAACANLARLDWGVQLHANVVRVGFLDSLSVSNSIVTMYSKCGQLGSASLIFHEMSRKDIVSWSTIIAGYAQGGCGEEAFKLLSWMRKEGPKPTEFALASVLSACGSMAILDQGFHYFKLMKEEYKISLSKEHYGCMIDLLCRAGRIIDAENMIKNMPFEKDDVVWSTLLRGCRLHGDVECGRRAAEQILKLAPNCAVTHTTLSNIYASKGKWGEVAELRKLMRLKGVMKEPGWSWIKVKDQVSAFVAGDKRHPQNEDIYDILDLISSKMEFSLQNIASILE